MMRLVLGTLFVLLGCQRFAMSVNRPEDFFTGQPLEVARLIQEDQPTRIPEAAKGLDINAVGKKGMTLLWFAIVKEHFACISTLVKLGADCYTPVEGLGTPVSVAMGHKDHRILKALLDGGLNPNKVYPKLESVLVKAIMEGRPKHELERVKLVVEAGANIDLEDERGIPAIDSALATMQLDIVNYLLDRGADVRYSSTMGITFQYSIHFKISQQDPSSPHYPGLMALKKRMESMGLAVPGDDPKTVRTLRRKKGLEVSITEEEKKTTR